MIAVVFLGLAAAVVVMQFVVSPRIPGHLRYQSGFDAELAEPGEGITYTGRLVNTWFLPAVYVSFAVLLPEGAVIAGRSGNHESYRLCLLPHHGSRHTLLFTLPRRGVYRGGRTFLETGDFLGFRSRVLSDRIDGSITVMPRKCQEEKVVRTLGGYIGDISVRRFIIEDPVLTIGLRDYTGREPMKKISWPHSARAGRLMVKDSDYTVDVNVAVVLNMASGTVEEKEKSLEIVRTVCEQLEERRIPYRFLSNGDVASRREGFGRTHLRALMTDLGRSELVSYTSFDVLIDRCIRERKNNRSYILVSPPLSAENRASLGRLVKYCSLEPCVLEAEVG